MDQLISTFHLSGQAIIAQVINLAIVIGILSLGLKPLMKIMRDRTERIEKSLEDAKKIEKNLAAAEEERERKLEEVKGEATRILEEARSLSEKNRTDNVAKTKKELEDLAMKAKIQIGHEKEQMLVEVKKEVAELVILATEKILAGVVDGKIDKKIVEKAIDEIKKS